jgi:transposase
MFTGWDWASETHDVTVIDDDGAVIERWALKHTEAEIDATIRRLRGLERDSVFEVAIESSNGLVVDRLLAGGLTVVPIHPNAFCAARPRWGASRAKSDPGDSYKLADYLRTDGHRLGRLTPLDRATSEIQTLCRLRGDHLAARVAATNQLASLLARHWPGATAIFARLDSEIALSFLENYPTPASARHLGEARLAQFCRRQHYSGRKSPAELLARLRAAPAASEILRPQVLAEAVLARVRLVRALRGLINDVDRALGAALAEHPRAALLATLPRVGVVSLAQLVGEVGPILERAASLEQACAEVGVCPVTKRSGKGGSVNFRWAVNAHARAALALYADHSRRASPWAQALYRDARTRGKRHPHAVRIVMRGWLRVIWACWQGGVAYDRSLHGGETRLARPIQTISVA